MNVSGQQSASLLLAKNNHDSTMKLLAQIYSTQIQCRVMSVMFTHLYQLYIIMLMAFVVLYVMFTVKPDLARRSE